MFPKLLLVIVSAGLVATALLAVRHQRLETANEMTAVHARMQANERALWSLRSAIARRCRPDEVKRMMDAAPNEWTIIPDPARVAPIEPDPERRLIVALGDEEGSGG